MRSPAAHLVSQEVSHHLALAPEVDGEGDGVKADLEIGNREIGRSEDREIGGLRD